MVLVMRVFINAVQMQYCAVLFMVHVCEASGVGKLKPRREAEHFGLMTVHRFHVVSA